MSRQESLKKALTSYLESIDKNNFHSSYDGAVKVLESYKKQLSKEEVTKVLLDIDEELEMNQYQEDVFLEIDSRLSGHCSDDKKIVWD